MKVKKYRINYSLSDSKLKELSIVEKSMSRAIAYLLEFEGLEASGNITILTLTRSAIKC